MNDKGFDKAGFYTLDEITYGQPFPSGLGGCEQFRIPGIITLDDGRLFAVTDARWTDADSDYGGIDTMFAVSSDLGRTWRAGFAALFPDTLGTPADPHDATTCIDPCAVQSADGAVHVLVNLCPTSVTTGLVFPKPGTGFIEAGGKKRLAVMTDCSDCDTPPSLLPPEKLRYLGDYAGGFAHVLTLDGQKTGFAADEYFNIFSVESGSPVMLTQPQIGSGKPVAQNLFYRDSVLHVYNTMYTLHLSSAGDFSRWRCEIISDRIKDEAAAGFISSPGNGTLTSDGICLMPFYEFVGDKTSFSSLVYTADGFKTFKKTPPVPVTADVTWSGECKAVELSKGLWRLFFRNDKKRICYADYSADSGSWSAPVVTDIKVHSECNFSAVKAGEKILASYPVGLGENCRHRVNGRLFTFTPGKDGSLILQSDRQIERSAFSYSCLTTVGDRVFVIYDTCEQGQVFFGEV